MSISAETLITRARALVPLLREQQDAADERGYYSDSVHRELLEAGLYRILQPKRFGGHELDLGTFLAVVTEIYRGHPSTGWCYTLASSHCLILASHWGEQAQRELFGQSGDFRASHRSVPAGKFKKMEGGYLIESGSWSYSSGTKVATHFGGGALLPDPHGKLVSVNFFVPREKVTILEDWGGDLSLGMRGSASHTVRIENVFVPDHHLSWGNFLLEQTDPQGTPGTRLHGNPMYLGVVGGPYHLTFSAMMLGTARAALEEFEQLIRTRKVIGNPSLYIYQQSDVQAALGEAMVLADSAEAIMKAAVELYREYCERWARSGTPIGAADTMRMWAMARQSCLHSCNAVELVFRRGTPTVTTRGHKLQRYFRDIQMYLVHPAAQPWVPRGRAQSHLGLPVEYFSARK
ncbi:MAG TPA: acyl-CoA dehydrogenase family protein [Steroidobacteraceae bacterium]|nr:acyl-CoA dehydrogenase family protein [Steroidobacteraceae bacterium]